MLLNAAKFDEIGLKLEYIIDVVDCVHLPNKDFSVFFSLGQLFGCVVVPDNVYWLDMSHGYVIDIVRAIHQLATTLDVYSSWTESTLISC